MYTQAQRDALAEAARDRLAFARRVERSVYIAGRDYTRFVRECSYSADDGIAWVLDAVVALPLERVTEGAECRVDWTLGGERFAGFRGRVVRRVSDGMFTRIVAATAGYEAQRTPLGRGPAGDVELVNAYPSVALYDALARLPYAGIEIPHTTEPRINRAVEDTLRWTQSVADVVAVVEDEAGLLARDRSDNVASAYLDERYAGEPVWVFEEGRDTDMGGVTEETGEDEHVYAVQCYRVESDGSHTAVTEPVMVENHGRRVSPRSVLLLEFTQEDAAAGDTAYRKAFREATRRGKLEVEVSVECVYPPFFVQRGDVVYARSRELLRDTVEVSRYAVRVDAVEVRATSGTVSGEARLVATDTLPRRRARFEPPPGIARALWGFDTDAQPYLDDALPWVSHEPGVVVLDSDVAALHGVTVAETPPGSGIVQVTW